MKIDGNQLRGVKNTGCNQNVCSAMLLCVIGMCVPLGASHAQSAPIYLWEKTTTKEVKTLQFKKPHEANDMIAQIIRNPALQYECASTQEYMVQLEQKLRASCTRVQIKATPLRMDFSGVCTDMQMRWFLQWNQNGFEGSGTVRHNSTHMMLDANMNIKVQSKKQVPSMDTPECSAKAQSGAPTR